MGGFGKVRVHNLYQFGIPGGKRHRTSLSEKMPPRIREELRTLLDACYNSVEAAVLFLERIPAAPLANYIRTLWYAQAGDIPRHRERILPSGCVQIILSLSRDFILDSIEGSAQLRVKPALVIGARSVYEIVDSSDMADLIGIVFEPGGFPVFASDSAHLFSNRTVALECIWGKNAEALRDRLREIGSPQQRLECMEQFLRAGFQNKPAKGNRSPEVNFALRYFAEMPSVASVRETARQIGWSERRFSQIFREEVGLAPKVWCRVQRFQRAVKQLHAGIEVRWAELALDCGYYDQSHFANEFRAFSGVDASTYTARRTMWANHIRAD